jgi:hypothetical protein
LLDSGVAIAQAACRKEWSSYLNFTQMYNLVYNQMKQAGVLKDLEEPVLINLVGEIVSSEAEAFGEKVSQIVKHADYVMFVNEVGNNTNMKDNGGIGGERLLKARGQTAEVTSATSDAHFTVLGFTAATREPVMCAVIFAAGEMAEETPTWSRHSGTDGRRRRQHPWQLWPWQMISWSPNLSVPWQNGATLRMLQPKRWYYIRAPEGDAVTNGQS